jgi:hypothetical protein
MERVSSPYFQQQKNTQPHKEDNMGLTSDINIFSTSYYRLTPALTVVIYHHVEKI